MIRKLFKIFFFLLTFQIFGQVYPVQMTPVFNVPYSSRLSDYATSMEVKMQLLINTTDIGITNRQVRLKMYVQGNGIQAQSKDVVVGMNPMYINGGELLTLTNLDLAALFRLENLEGISPAQYATNLPEGLYSICFELYDYLTQQRISQKSCAQLYLMLNEPPLLNTPARNESIAVTEFPNILFTWTPRQINATNVSYQFELKEILDPTIDPQIGFLTSPILYEEELRSTALLYDISKPNLLPGKRYAWRVRAISTSGVSLNNVFKNDGYSEIYTFTYASHCPAPSFLLSEAVSARSVRISWLGDKSHTKYHVQYRKANVVGAEWFEVYTMNSQTTLSDLEAGVSYEFRVGGSCEPAVLGNTASFTYSGINQFSMPAAGTSNSTFTCGLNPTVAIANQTPITNLIVGETFTAGDFPVKILRLNSSPSGGGWEGAGYIIVPYLADTKIAVVFNAITINTNYQLIKGVVETTYNPEAPNISDVEDLSGGNNGQIVTQTVPFVITTVTVNPNGDIIVSGANGEQITIPGGSNTVITGSNGQIYNVDSQGNVTGPFTPAPGGATTAANTDGVASNGQTTQFTAQGITVTFEPTAATKYSWDTVAETAPSHIKDKYAKVGSTYLPYKAVVNGQSDVIKAKITLTDTAIKLEDIIFKTQHGILIDKVKEGDHFILTLKGTKTFAEEEVQAVIKQGDTYKVAGAFKLVHISERPINVTLIPLNSSNSIPSSAIAQLQEVYAKAGVTLNLKTAPVLTYDGGDDHKVTTSESGVFDYYTDEEKTINAKIKALPDYDPITYYLIYSNLPSDKGIDGFMALYGQFGYVFPSGGAKTAAHELAHGVFALQHPFTNTADKGKTPFLMDYGSGTELWHTDWAQINNPALKYYGFQGDSQGELVKGVYYDPSGFPIELSLDYKGIVSVYQIDNNLFPNGALAGWIENGVTWLAKIENGKFKGYYSGDNYYKRTSSLANKEITLTSQHYDGNCDVTYFTNKYTFSNNPPEKAIYDSGINILENPLFNEGTKVIKLNIENCKAITCGVSTMKSENVNKILKTVTECSSSFDNNLIFSDSELKGQLCAEDRYKIIKCLLSGTVVDNDNENTIIKIIDTTPKEQASQLLEYIAQDSTGLLKHIQNDFQLGNYTEVYVKLMKLFHEGSDPNIINNEIRRIENLYDSITQNGTKKISFSDLSKANTIIWLNKGFLERLSELDLNYFAYKDEKTSISDQGEISFEIEWTTFMLSHGSVKYENLKPFTILKTILENDEAILNAKKGDVVYLPAFFMSYLVHEKFKREAIDAVNVGIILGTLGSGAIAQGGATGAWATFDMAYAATALTVDSFRNQISTTSEGKVFLAGWETFNKAFVLYAALKLSVATFEGTVNTFKNVWNTYKSSKGYINFKQLNPAAATRLEEEIIVLFNEATASVNSGKTLQVFENTAGGIKFTPNTTGTAVSVENGALTVIKNCTKEGKISSTYNSPTFSNSFDGNAALKLDLYPELKLVTNAETKVIQMPKSNTATGYIEASENATNLISYNLNYYKGIQGTIQLIIAREQSATAKPQVVYAAPETAKKLKEKEENNGKCTIYDKFGQPTCYKFKTLLTETNDKSGVDKLYHGLIQTNASSVVDGIIALETDAKVFLNDIQQSNATISGKIPQYSKNTITTWDVLHDNKKQFARKDWTTIVELNKLNNEVRTQIIKFSDATNASSTLKEFTADLEKINGFSDFLNKHPQFARGFVGHKQDPLYKAEDYELLTPESIEEIPLDINLITTINDWLKYSKEDANRRNYFKMGKDFENYIISKLSSPESLEYKALEQKIPDLSERSIYTQVYFCINGDQTGNCTNEGDYFIADFVFVKEIQVGNTSILDARIADTKLSVNTDFTKNQKAAMNLSKYYIRSIPTESRSNPIKGNPLPNFQKGASVSKSGSFIKIYSGGSATSFGGVK